MSATDSGEDKAVTERDGEDRIAAALAPFGWTCTEEFWQRYYSDPWVFNLANAVERLHRLTEGDPTSIYHEAAALRAERDALRAENVDLLASREYWVQTRVDEISLDLAALRERAEGVEYERDLFAEIIRDPAKLLRHLLDARGVEPQEWVGPDGLPTTIRIPPDLSRSVFASRCGECGGMLAESVCIDCGTVHGERPCGACEGLGCDVCGEDVGHV